MAENRIILNVRQKTATVTLNRMAKNNAFDEAMFKAIEQVTETLKQSLPRAVVLTGAGDRAFCAGFDVNLDNPITSGFLEAVNKKDRDLSKKLVHRMRQAIDGFFSLPVPVIAAVNGLAYGGGMELATRCDLRVMDTRAELCFSEVRLGLMPDWGGGPYLARLVGPAVAADLILTARKINVDEALKLGLVNRVSDPGRSLETAMDLAEQIAENGPRAVAHALGVIRQSHGLPLEKALEMEADAAAELIASGECVHGITAFIERRTPEFPD
jgi:enoyl-CoA hydratase